MHVAHRGLNAIVSSNILQGKGIGVLSGFSEESVPAGVNPGVRMRVDFFLQEGQGINLREEVLSLSQNAAGFLRCVRSLEVNSTDDD